MSTEHEFSVEGEAFWRELKINLEWAKGFELIMLFSNNPIISQLVQQYIKAIDPEQQTPINYFEPESADTLIVDCLGFLDSLAGNSNPIWLELSQYGDDWTSAHTSVLGRINERRDGLRKRNPQPLVIVLNADFARKIQSIAPDLWSVRCLSRVLTQDFLITPQAVGQTPLLSSEADYAGEKTDDINQHPLLIEWQRLLDNNAEGVDVVYAGYDAFRVSFDMGYYTQAEQITEPLLKLAQKLNQASPNEPDILRALSFALTCLGDIYEVQGNLPQAKDSYTESLETTRQIQQLSGDQPEVLRDISISFEKLGSVNQALDNLTEASSLYSESLAIHRQRQQLLGDQPEVLREISVSLEKLGEINQQQGDLTQALALFSESLALRRQLQQSLGEQPETLRDISVSLDRLGDVNQLLGNLNQALTLLSESLAMRQQLQQIQGDQPQVLKDICASQINLGELHQQLGQQDKAVEYFNQSLALLHRLQKITPRAAYIERWMKYVNEQLKTP